MDYVSKTSRILCIMIGTLFARLKGLQEFDWHQELVKDPHKRYKPVFGDDLSEFSDASEEDKPDPVHVKLVKQIREQTIFGLLSKQGLDLSFKLVT